MVASIELTALCNNSEIPLVIKIGLYDPLSLLLESNAASRSPASNLLIL